MNGEHLSSVTIVGRISERPTMSETESGVPLAHFHVVLGDNRVWCLCRGAVAQNIQRFGHVGVEIVGTGILAWTSDRPEQPHVHLHRLGFTTPTELSELMEHGL